MNTLVRQQRVQSPKPVSLRALGAVVVAQLLVSAVVVMYAIHGGMPRNALRLPLETQVSSVLWAPQGWKFFTRDAREERTSLYVHRDGEWRSAARTPNASVENLLGANRRGRAQGIELGLLLENVPATAWQKCDGEDAMTCLDAATEASHPRNVSPNPSLCGEVGLVSQRPVPWAWAHLGLHVAMPITVLRLEVPC